MELEALLRRACRGDEAARDELYHRLHDRVRAAVHRDIEQHLRRGPNAVQALLSTGDIVQDVFGEVLRSLEDIEGTCEAAFTSLLVTMCKHRLLDQIRRYHAARRDVRRQVGVEAIAGAGAPNASPLDAAQRGEQVRIYREVLGGFAPRHRLLLELRLEVGESFVEIARQLGFPTPDATRKAFHEAHARLLVALKRRGVHATRSTL